MTIWYRSILSVQEALVLANANLDNARNTEDRERALKFCHEAKKALRRIDVSASMTDRIELDQIIAAYRQLGRMLEGLGFSEKALKSYNLADKLRGKSIQGAPAPLGASNVAQALPPSPPSKNVLLRGNSPLHPVAPIVARSPPSLPSTDVPVLRSTPVPPVAPSTTLPVSPLPSSNAIPSRDSTVVLECIFAKDIPPPVSVCKLPEADERLADTRQLAYCLGILQASPLPDDALDLPARTWLEVTEKNPDEQERLKTMATDLIRAFTRDELKDTKAIAEVVCLAPVLEEGDFRIVLSQFVNGIEKSILLDVHTLEGLAQLIQSAAPGYIDSDDLVKILRILSIRLQETHQQSLRHIYQLTLTVSHILDAMADSDIKGLKREELHAPLSGYLHLLQASDDPYLVYQAAYAFQALQYIPDNETPWQATLRRTEKVVKDVSGLVSAVKTLDIHGFITTLGNIQEGLAGAKSTLKLAKNAYEGVSGLAKSGQGLLDSLKEGFSLLHKRAWYPALRGTDTLLRNGELAKFKTLVYDTPCCRDLAFQWGVCQHLGNLAADPLWDTDSRQGAVAFLGEIYRDDAVWGQEAQVKQCILNILMQLASISGSAMPAAEALLQDLGNDGDATKRALYQASRKEGPSSHPWKVASLPLASSSLLDHVQNKPSVEADLRRFQRLRLQELGSAVYIPPQAKANRQAAADDLDRKVLLLLGDSGAGKSTFNRELEGDLWRAYKKYEGRIPVFVTLPAIEKPEQDLIAKQLRNADFSEAQIRELKAYREFVLICDGYDECQQTHNLYTSNRLNQHGEWNAKMVISCRSEYLGPDYRYLFLPGDRNDRTGTAQFQEAVIAPFSEGKIQDYIEKYVKYVSAKESLWKVEDYSQVIDEIPSLQDLVKNPFLLTLSLEVLPTMVDLGKNLPSTKVTRVALYDEFVEQWIERGKRRLTEKELSEHDRRAFGILSNEGFSQNAIQFVKDLAVAIFAHQDGKPVVQYSSQDKATWKVKFFSHDDGKNLLREACPLRCSGNQYRFIHRSVLEYGLARAVFEPPSREEDKGSSLELAVSPIWRRSVDRAMSFNYQGGEEVLVPIERAIGLNSPLFRRSYVNEPSILQFLAERVQQEPCFKQQLLDFIEYSKTDNEWSIAAANAITILVRAGVQFNGANLRGLRIPGADLSGGQFNSAQLQGADLRGANLRNIWLRQADLSNAQMANIQFGEWPYLQEEGKVFSCVYSPDRKTCAVGLGDSTIVVYDTATWEKALTLCGHTDKVRSVVYSPSGWQIASGSEDNTVQLWDAQTGAPGPNLSGHADSVTSVAYSPSGQQIASGSEDKTVRLWDAQTGAPGSVLSGHIHRVNSVVYSPSGQQIASGSEDKTVRLWDAQTGAPGPIFSGHTSAVRSVAYSPSGQQIASGSIDKTVRLWDAQTGSPGPILSGHTNGVFSVVYSPSGQQIASGSDDKTVRLWDAQTGAPGSVLSGHANKVNSVVYSPSGQQIASGSEDKTVRLWDAQTGAPDPNLSSHADRVTSVAYSPSGQQIASGSDDHTVRLWDAQTGAPGPIFSGHTGTVRSVVYSPGGQQIASGSIDKTVRLWNAQTGAPGPILSGHTNGVFSVVYSPSGQQIASGSDDKTVRLWDVQTGAPGSVLSGHANRVNSVVYSPSGQQIASGSEDKTVRLWDARTGAPGPILSGHTNWVTSVAYSPSGQQIASGSTDTTVRFWDSQTGAPGLILSGHTIGRIPQAANT
ncbi:hypothetical protein BGX26_012239 [Mortierella sp. AD094]|nr:hypothetical protein BGX26_012239 [Mortierella sp. AD094]